MTKVVHPVGTFGDPVTVTGELALKPFADRKAITPVAPVGA